MTDGKRELPLVRWRIEALLKKTVANGCTAGEAASAFEKAEELVGNYGFDPSSFRWPPRPSATSDAPTSGPISSKPPRSAGSRRRGLGVGALARSLIVEHPDWTYRRIAEEVNARIEGARASEKSVRWYSHQMRKRGVEGTGRSKRVPAEKQPLE
jgi:hypothetical protein